jgi:hypothetical protein
MGTLLEDFNALKIKVAAAMAKNDQATLNQKTHIVFVDQERQARKKPGHKTRFTFDLQSNDLYRQVWLEWDRILVQIVNVTVARHIVGQEILRCFRELTPERIKELLEMGENDTTTGPKPGPSPPKAEIPEWLR